MQTSKMKNGTSDAPKRTSPTILKLTRATNSTGTDTGSSTSRLTPTKAPTERSPKGLERRSPRSPSPVIAEKKNASRLIELESQLTQLQEDLKKTKENLTSSESLKKQAQLDAEDFKQKLEESQNDFVSFTESEAAREAARFQELQKISQDRDWAWQSELEAIQRQHSVDSAALSSAMNEIERLKLQLEIAVKSEAESLSTLEKLKMEVSNSKKAEAEAEAKLVETQQQLEVAKALIETFGSEGMNSMEKLNMEVTNSKKGEAGAETKVVETQQQLDVSKAIVETPGSDRTNFMEKLEIEVSNNKIAEAEAEAETKVVETQQQLDVSKAIVETPGSDRTNFMEKLEIEVSNNKIAEAEAEAEAKVAETQQQLEVANAVIETLRSEGSKLMELLSCSESELEQSKTRVSLLEEIVKKLKDDIVHIRNSSKPGSLESEVEQRSALEATRIKYEEAEQVKVASGEPELAELRGSALKRTPGLQSILDKENELQRICEENEQLKVELLKREVENNKIYESTISEMELAKAKEKEALLVADKMTQKAERVSEQLEMAKAVNVEMEVELRRLRVQSEQWRKAAEAAAAVLTTGTNHSLDAEYQSVAQKLVDSPFCDDLDLDDDSPKKSNSNVLRKLGGLWKKNPK